MEVLSSYAPRSRVIPISKSLAAGLSSLWPRSARARESTN